MVEYMVTENEIAGRIVNEPNVAEKRVGRTHVTTKVQTKVQTKVSVNTIYQ